MRAVLLSLAVGAVVTAGGLAITDRLVALCHGRPIDCQPVSR